jgi:hypothetical protein
MKKANSIISIAFRQYLPDVISCSACKVLYISAFPIEIRKDNNLFLVKLA